MTSEYINENVVDIQGEKAAALLLRHSVWPPELL